MISLDSLRAVLNMAAEEDCWVCLRSGNSYNIFKIEQGIIDEFLKDYIPTANGQELRYVKDNSLISSVAYAKDWNYFKNTMVD